MGNGKRAALWGVLIIVVGYSVWHFWPEPVIERAAGALCPDVPVQTPPTRKTPWLCDEYMITALADYTINAVVLSRKNYSSDAASDLSPVDLALGWGRMSDSFVYGKLEIWQGPRCYKWRPEGLEPLPRREIEISSANVHIIPGNDKVDDALDDVCKGSVVRMQGYLIKATRDGNWRWASSTTRNDTGDGACEVLWVESLVVEN